jgi:hypothetical protein
MVVATAARSERLEPVCLVLIVDDETRDGGRYCGSVGKTWTSVFGLNSG